MGMQAIVKTPYGEGRNLYIRLNNVEASNHGFTSRALFRGFLSEEAFQNGASYMWERLVEFDADVSHALWPQAYAALQIQLEAEAAGPAPIDGGVDPAPEEPIESTIVDTQPVDGPIGEA